MPQPYAVRNKFEIFLGISFGIAENARMEITAGTKLMVITASGEQVPMRAIRHPQRGSDFPVVWVCTETEFERCERSGSEPDGVPWPLDAVRELAVT